MYTLLNISLLALKGLTNEMYVDTLNYLSVGTERVKKRDYVDTLKYLSVGTERVNKRDVCRHS